MGNLLSFIVPIGLSYLFKMFTLTRKRKALIRVYEEKKKQGQSEIQIDHTSKNKLIGEYRFCAPEKAPDSDRVYEVFCYGKSAPQSLSVYINSSLLQGEDCLTINIWTKKFFSEKE